MDFATTEHMDFLDTVNKKIEEEYIPIGNPFYKSTIGCEWHQAMILKTCLK